MARPPGLARHFAKHWLLLGCLLLAGDAAFAIAHYLYGVTGHDRRTGDIASEGTIALTLVMLALVGALFATLGGLYLWFARKRPETSPFRL